MMFSTTRNALLPLLAAATAPIASRTTIPVLANVLVEAADGRLRLAATDLDQLVTVGLGVDMAQPGRATLPGRMLHQILAKLPDGAPVQITHDAQAQRARLTAGRARFDLPTLPAADFPAMKAPGEGGDEPSRFSLAAPQLVALLGRPAFAMSREETRYYLNGVYLHRLGERLAAVATDGHRLARATLAAPAGAERIDPVILPRDTVANLLKLKPEGEVTIAATPTRVSFSWGDITLMTKVIDGQFPDYERVIPKADQQSVTARIERKPLATTLDRVMAVATDRTRSVRLALGPGAVTVSATEPEHGSAEDTLDLADYAGEPLTIGFNGRYLIDGLEALAGDSVTFHGDSAGSPALITDPDDPDILVVVMPMRV
ncbi:MAG: DNA polymerase III subunit beta [Alphaproteobacteria bacterium]|jgi:DNA polymerase-3 subunit beta|nr:DNA polymerase III subunit beta [Alphaproteobacteria bacterium]